MMSVRPSVHMSLKIWTTTEPILLFREYTYWSCGGLSYFLGGWDTPNPPKNKRNPLNFFQAVNFKLVVVVPEVPISFKLPLGAKPLEARVEAASCFIKCDFLLLFLLRYQLKLKGKYRNKLKVIQDAKLFYIIHQSVVKCWICIFL